MRDYVNLCSIFVNIIIGSVTLPKNMTVINAVPAGTHKINYFNAVNNALDGCLLYLSCSVFLHRILFCLVRMVFLAAGSPLTSPLNLAYQLQMCYEN